MPATGDETTRLCERCDDETTRLINFLSPDNVPEMVCWRCVEQEGQGTTRFSTGWIRQRRQAGKT